MIYVTHDQTEALTFADKVVVMYEGEVVQIGTPEELFNEPAHTFVGYFIGSPGMNVIPCEINGKTANVGNIEIELPAGYKTTGAKSELGIRPEFVSLSSDKSGLPVQIDTVENIGRFKIVRANLQGHAINALLKENEEVPADPTLSFETAQDQCV
jgi:glycerol transport system ATP-binding protein